MNLRHDAVNTYPQIEVRSQTARLNLSLVYTQIIKPVNDNRPIIAPNPVIKR
jgi:hypothetical protein